MVTQPQAIEGFALSDQQEHLWLLQAGHDAAYHAQGLYLLEGNLDTDLLQRALEQVLSRHEILRTRFRWLEGMDLPLQVIAPDMRVRIEHVDLSGLADDAQQAQTDALYERVRNSPLWNADQLPLQTHLITLGCRRHLLLVRLPALCADASTLRNLMHEIRRCYAACAGEALESEESLQYVDYTQWQQEATTAERAHIGQKHWQQDWSGDRSSELPFTRLKGGEPRSFEPASLCIDLDLEAVRSIQEQAQEDVSVREVLFSSWLVLLWRLMGGEGLTVAAACDGRDCSELESPIGLYERYLPIRLSLMGEQSMADVVRKARLGLLNAYRFQDYFSWKTLGESASGSRQAPGVGVGFAFAYEVEASPERITGDLAISLPRWCVVSDRFCVRLSCIERAEALTGELHYDQGRVSESDARWLGEALGALMSSAAADAHAGIATLNLLSCEEREQLLVEWNATEADYSRYGCVHELFEEQVQRTPQAVAVVYEEEQLTYAELNRRANRLAHYLQTLGVGPDVRVGLCLERSVDLIVGVLGILKAGGAYVPLDPALPQERRTWMLNDSGAKVLLTHQALVEVADASTVCVCVDRDVHLIDRHSEHNPPCEVQAHHLVYVIYTSGSTGRPKGVGVEHRHLLNYVLGVSERLGLKAAASYASVSTLAADLGNTMVFPSLCLGGCLHLISSERAMDAVRFGEYLCSHRIDYLKIVPSHLWALLGEGAQVSQQLPREVLVLGGEASSWELVAKIREACPGLRVFNHYGPTETTVGVLTHAVELAESSETTPSLTVPLGRPLPNTQVYVLNAYLQPVPVGVVGELYIGGAGVSRGYLGHEELTQERFVSDRFSGEAGARLYRTGDLCRYLSDGNVEFVGRVDHQVKIRGFRIELGEIESVLLSHPEVREAVVEAREDVGGEKRLVGYVVGQTGSVSVSALRAHLGEKLPEYMVPSAWVVLEQLPLTSNGKVDRKALAAPESQVQDEGYVGARTPVEEGLSEIWREILRVDEVGVHTSFFALGGHSLLATQVISRIRSTFAVELSLRALFEAPTIAGLAERIGACSGEEGSGAPALVRVSREGRLPLSFAQQRLWFIDQMEPESCVYNIPMALRLSGPLDVAALEQSLHEIVLRHEALRTTFTLEAGVPSQVIHEGVAVALPVVDLSTLAAQEREREARRLITEEAQRPFDLQRGPLFRFGLLRLGEAEHVLLLTLHHIVSDGWSQGVLRRELQLLYNAFHAGRPSPLSELAIQYADYAAWQREWLQGEPLQRQVSYWKECLNGAPTLLELPTDRPRPPVQTFRGARVRREFSSELTAGVKALGQREGTTLFMTLLAAFQTLLARYSHQDDIVVGTPIANRTQAEVEGVIGFFVNTLVLRGDLSGDPSFVELLGRVREVCLGGYAHQDLPFEKLVEELQPQRSLSHTPVFQVLFSLANAPGSGLGLEGVEIAGMGSEGVSAKFDLSLILSERSGQLWCTLEYNTDLFDADRMERMLGHLEVLLAGIVSDPQQKVSRLPLLTQAEGEQLAVEWNATDVEYPRDRCIHELFEEHVARAPDAVAVAFENQTLTYQQLNAQSNRLAHHLKSLGVGPDVRVGLCLERSVDLIVGLLGILKAGGAYVPLDPALPQERRTWMLNDSGAKVLLTHQALVEVADASTVCVCVDRDVHLIDRHSEHNPPREVQAHHLVYVIYTSGSTGRPKGVGVEHRHLLNYVLGVSERLGLKAAASYASVSTLAADLGNTMVFPSLCLGGCLHLISSERAMDAVRFGEYLCSHRIDYLKIVPSHLWALLGEGAQVSQQLPREVLVLGGEASSWELVAKIREACPGLRVFNHYGPTETTVGVLTHAVELAESSETTPSLTVPLGRPLPNTQVYVLNAYLQPVPVGVVGELYIGGAGVSRGYLGHEELTQEKFVSDRFSGEAGARLYRTGDLCRYLSDGNVEFVGRVDHQVKIRGFRIELGEIESVLLSHPEVREAVVEAREDVGGEKRLVGYVVGQAGSVSVSALRAYLGEKLPEYMVPSAWVVLEQLPLTPNGKVDRKALAAPESQVQDEGYVGARTPVEEGLSEIWREILRVDEVGVHTSFFALGGHSLLATQVISRIRSTFAVELPLRALFEAPTIAGLAERIGALGESEGSGVPPLVRVSREGRLPLSFAQQRLWFIDQWEPESAVYNVPSALRLTGALDMAALTHTLQEIVLRHEALRTTFAVVEGEPFQVIHQAVAVTLPVVDLSSVAGAEREREARRLIQKEAQRPFDLQQGPLFRFSVLRLQDQEHVLLLTLHHIVSDGWSQGVLTRELTALYRAFSSGAASPLPALPIQYADYAAWQREWLQGEPLQRQLSYWKERLGGAPPLLELPGDRPRPPIQTFRGARVRRGFSAELTAGLKGLGQREGTTLFMTLLAAFQTLLYRYSNQDDIVVGTPIANRTQAELEGLIGFFVNTLVLRGDLSGDPSFVELLGRVREVCLGGYAHQDLPFEKLVEELQPQRSLSHSPLFQVMFVFQNAPRGDRGLEGLGIERIGSEGVTAKFDLIMFLWEARGQLWCTLEYNLDLFDAGRIERMLGHFERLLEGIVSDPHEKLSRVPLLTEAEREQSLVAWNDTSVEYPRHRCLHELFEEQVERTPHAVALVHQQQQLTYQQLNARANQLAHLLQAQGVQPDTLVAVCMNRSLDMVVALLGVLKAGAAYVALDPAYPAQRIQYTLDDANAALLITQQALDKLPQTQAQTLCLDRDRERLDACPTHNPASEVSPDALAYVLYTSGSTGLPKGVAIEHRSPVALVSWALGQLSDAELSGVVFATSICFDLSVYELFVTLCGGGRVLLVENALAIAQLPASLAPTLINTVPSAMAELLRMGALPSSVCRVNLAGEPLSGSLVDAIYAQTGVSKVYDLYGPSEDTTYSTCALRERGGVVSIGRPISNTRAYVLDGSGQPVPVGVVGELYLGGAGLARGYLNQAELTASKFVKDPFSKDAGARLYRTGDLVRYLSDGNLEFVGRADHQVKLRGFRIELGEIESVLLGHAAVREAVVVAREDEPGDKRLVAYVVADREALKDLEELRDTEAEQTTQWQAVWNARYGEPNLEDDVEFNIQGWLSSYTGLPIPSHEMHEWVDQTVASILALQPRRLVEIGCGTGLLVFRIAPHCHEYIATDFSSEALRYVERALTQTQIPACTVKLQQKMADEFADFGSEAPDTVVLNSVVQYFPSIDYLLQVLEKAVVALANGGSIFLGDLRSLTLLEEFQAAVELHQASDATDRQRMWQRIQQAVAEEDELLIDPAFFYALRERLPQITRAEVQLKRGRYWNEMSQFRYDVVLHVGPEQARPVEVSWQDWKAEGLSVASLERLLQQQPDVVALTAVPNARMAAAVQARELMAQTQGPQTAAEIRAAVETQRRPGVDPEGIWELGAAHGYSVRIRPSGPWHRGCMDVVLCSPSARDAGTVAFPNRAVKSLTSYANDPVRGKLVATFVPQLRRYVLERLPEYMAPSSFTLLDALPLTPSGKVDRKALPSPDLARPDITQDYEAPQTEVERDLAGLWAEVLRLERVGRRHNFFELGGHSLLATQVIARIRKTFEVELPLRAMFEAPTVAEFGVLIAEAKGDTAPGVPALVRVSREGRLPLSFAQQRLWFIDQWEPESAVYNVPSALRLTGALDMAALTHTLQEIVLRHEALRTTFAVVEGEPFQVIHQAVAVTLPVVDLSSVAGAEREREARRLIQKEAQRPFDLQQGPLFRFSVLRLQDQEHVLLLTLHHIVSDGWSQGVLTRELTALYRAFSSGAASPLPALPIQYADYAAWQREWLQGEPLQRQLSYWKERLGGAPPLLELPGDRPRPPIQTFRGARVRRGFSAELTAGLKGLGQREGTTLFMTLLAAFQTLLYRYSNQDDIVVGTPIANRTQAELEGLIGFFVNTLVLRGDLSGDPSFVELLGRVREVCLGGYAHQDLPFEKLVEELQPQRSLSHSPLFQVMFVFQNAPRGDRGLEGLGIERIGSEGVTAKFDLIMFLWEARGQLWCTLEYNLDLFDAGRIERMLGHFERLLEGIVSDPHEKLSRVPLLTEAEREQSLVAWNDTSVEYPRHRCLHELFEEQVERTPHAVALVHQQQQLTYQQLNARANQLAHLLQAQGVQPDTLVAVCMNRSLDMVVALLGVLKAGAAYVALDPAYPAQRIQYTLDDANAALLITQQALDKLPQTQAQTLCLDRDRERLDACPTHNPASEVSPDALAYVLYTSGSTGLPKGVAIEHRSPVALVSWALGQLSDAELSGVVFATSICFDLSVYELFVTLCGGGRVLLVENALAIAQLPASLAPTLINTVPSAMAELLRMGALPSSVCRVNLAGEPLSGSLVDAIYAQTGVSKVYDLYGPSEDTTYSTCALRERGGVVSIGRPISNTRAYVLDGSGQPVPVGVVGELYLGGAGLARGYLNQAELTASKFVKDPFSKDAGARLYRTGDLVRYLSDGNLEFVGRADHQVKLRGFRIELGEIESVLTQHPAVREAVVLAREDEPGDKCLVAYLVAQQPDEADRTALCAFLKERLPDYMLPVAWMWLDTLPLSPNGKVDRKALPAPDGGRQGVGTEYQAPQNPIELELAKIWTEILRVDKIGVHDSFFDLGGHSLLAAQMIVQIRQAFQIKMPLRVLFETPTLAGLAEHIAAEQRSETTEAQPLVSASRVTPVRKSTGSVSLFCAAAPTVNALGYAAIGRYLEDSYSLFVLQSNYFSDGAKPSTRKEIRNLAAHYIAEMRITQPEGPYCLGGMCQGAHIAFEMARQLQEAGEQVPMLVSFDTWPEENTRTRFGWWLNWIDQLIKRYRKDRTTRIGWVINRVAAVTFRVLREWVLLPFRPPAPDSWEARYWPGRSFAPPKYRGHITVLRAREQKLYRPRSRDLGWSPWTTEGTDVYNMPGDHITMLREPNVGAVASVLQRQLDRVQSIDRPCAVVSTAQEWSVVRHEEEISCERLRS